MNEGEDVADRLDPSFDKHPSFGEEIAQARRFERKLMHRALFSFLLVVVVVVIRTLFFT